LGTLGTHLELELNIEGICGNKGKIKKNPPHTPSTQNFKEKNQGTP
jgi:hypothetical protein